MAKASILGAPNGSAEQFAEKVGAQCSAPKGAIEKGSIYGIAKAMP